MDCKTPLNNAGEWINHSFAMNHLVLAEPIRWNGRPTIMLEAESEN